MTILPSSYFAPLTHGNSDDEKKLRNLYDRLSHHQGKLILVEERYTEIRTVLDNDLDFNYVRISLGTIQSPFLKVSKPAEYPLSMRMSDGQGDLEIITQKNACLNGKWSERGTHLFLREDTKAKSISVPSKLFLNNLPVTEYMRFSGCRAIASCMQFIGQAGTMYIDQEVDAFFVRQPMVLEEEDKIIKRDSAGVYKFLKQKLQ